MKLILGYLLLVLAFLALIACCMFLTDFQTTLIATLISAAIVGAFLCGIKLIS